MFVPINFNFISFSLILFLPSLPPLPSHCRQKLNTGCSSHWELTVIFDPRAPLASLTSNGFKGAELPVNLPLNSFSFRLMSHLYSASLFHFCYVRLVYLIDREVFFTACSYVCCPCKSFMRFGSMWAENNNHLASVCCPAGRIVCVEHEALSPKSASEAAELSYVCLAF